MKKLDNMAKNELQAKCKKLENILSHNNSSDLNGIELYEELNTLPSISPNEMCSKLCNLSITTNK